MPVTCRSAVATRTSKIVGCSPHHQVTALRGANRQRLNAFQALDPASGTEAVWAPLGCTGSSAIDSALHIQKPSSPRTSHGQMGRGIQGDWLRQERNNFVPKLRSSAQPLASPLTSVLALHSATRPATSATVCS